MITVSKIMSKDVYVVQPRQTLAYVRNLFLKKKISRVLVFDGKPLGVLTEKDLARVFSEERRSIDEIRVAEIMRPEVITILPGDSPEKAAALMLRKNVSGLPVLSAGEIQGIITKTDLAEYFCEAYKDKTTVAEIMHTKVPTVKEFHTVFHAAKTIKNSGLDHCIVLRDKKIAGILSERDLGFATFGVKPTRVVFFRKRANGLTQEQRHTYAAIVGDLMQEKIYTTSPDEEAAHAVKEMLKKNIGSLVVEKRGKLEGILTKTCVLEYLAENA